MSTKHDADIADTDIAIVGIAIRAPGAPDYRSFWKNLEGGVESIRRLSEAELIAAGEDPAQIRRKNYVPVAAPLEGMEQFDGEFFGFSPKESAILDPQHRHFLETAWEALEDAGHPPERFDGPIGVFAGSGMGSYFYFNLCTNPELVANVGMFLLRHTGNDKDFLATRASYLFNLSGPSINVQTACSTSLVAVHLACQSLISGECDMAIAGGSTIELPHRRGYLFRENEILSPDGHCRAFDHRSKGTVFGSGVGVVVLRPLKAALKDGDHVHAVIRGSAINNDGAGKAGYLAPSVDGQAAAVVEALGLAGVGADTIDYVECHGTGTYLGDPIEVAALTRAFRQSSDKKNYCGIGSVKTNIGHTDTAAGVIGLIKTSLALENAKLPPSLNFEKPNPTIEFEGSPFYVNAKLKPWAKKDRPRRASVNSLGVGGTNAHVVLDEAPARPPAAASGNAYQLLSLSARNRAALDEGCDRLANHLEQNPGLSLADVAYTLNVGRRAFAKRRVLAAKDTAEAITLLRTRPEARVYNASALEGTPSVMFMLPGGGAQYPNMARGLYESEPLFREIVDRGIAFLQKRLDYDIKEILYPAPDKVAWAAERFQKPSVQLPAIFIIEYALAKLLLARGITPAGLIGHSLGENTAACLAEVFTFEEGIGLVHLRGTLFDQVPPGGMLSVPLSLEQLEPILPPELDLACVNSPGLCVVSGPDLALKQFQEKLAASEVVAQRVPINIAAHSRMLEGILKPFGDYVRGLKLKAPKLKFISNRSGTWIKESEATSPDYWVQHLRHTVRFAEGIKTLAEDKSVVFLEVGPGKTLGSLAKQNPAVNNQAVISTLRHAEEKVDDRAFFQTVLGRLWANGVDLPPAMIWGKEARRRVPLPTYAFQRQHYWIEPGKVQAPSAEPELPVRLDDLAKWFYEPVWRRLDPAVDGEPPPAQSWLIFLDETGLGARLTEKLRARGDEVITVQAGDAFYKVSDKEYWLSPEHGAEGYQALIRDILASGRAPGRIVHLWLLAEGETFRPGSNFFHRNQERGFYSLLFLAQALASEDYPRPLHIATVSLGMQKIGEEGIRYPEQATVLGPVRVIPRELPGVTCASIDLGQPERGAVREQLGKLEKLDKDGTWKRLVNLVELPKWVAAQVKGQELAESPMVERLIDELLLPPANAVVALRKDGRWIESHQRARLSPSPAPVLRAGGVYLITGGLGGIGLAIARSLAREHKARLVLVARTALPPREEWGTWLKQRPSDPITPRIRAVRDLEAAGAEVLVASGDVADADRMEQIVAEAKQRFGALNGVFHAAGLLDDGLIPTKRLASVEKVFGPKVHGTIVLDKVLKHEPIDFLLLFSSTSAVIGPAGQIDYAAANQFLNSYAKQARTEGRPVTAINWGVWADVGMAAEAADRMGLAPERPEAPAQYPHFDTKEIDPGRGGEIRGALTPGKVWFLDEHRTVQQRAVLPGTGYLELVRAALREAGDAGPFSVRDLFFFRALEVPDGTSLPFRVRLKMSDEGYLFDVQSRHALEPDAGQGHGDRGEPTRAGWLLHAQGNLVVGHAGPAPEKVDLAAIDARCQKKRTPEVPAGIRSRQEEHMAFGPRWRVLHQALFGEGEALGRLVLADSFAADVATHGLHPALLDIATGFALELVPGYGSSAPLWVPVSYRKVTVHADLPARVASWVRLRRGDDKSGFAAFDVTICDPDGNVLVEIEEFTMHRLRESDITSGRGVTAADLEREERQRERELSPAELAFQHSLSQGITPAEGLRALEQVLGTPGRAEVVVSSMDLRALTAQADKLGVAEEEPETKFSRPQLESSYVAPENEIEKTLAGLWESLLGVNQIGTRDNFFELGGHSLIAVRLFAKIRKIYNVDHPISVLFEAPTIEAYAKLIAEALGGAAPAGNGAPAAAPAETAAAPSHRTRYTHLVPMHQSQPGAEPRLPFFLVAGMFGNVLNLRHVAQLVGSDRPFYGLQARGLYGDHKPHETFEDMARDYIAELRTVQPHGPYLLGGFSGGGITAYEMARQLRAAGDEVAVIVMLDTPLPKDEPLSKLEKLAIHRQNFDRRGPKYVVEWLAAKQEYKKRLREQAKRTQEQLAHQNGHDFHSQVIEAAFYQAVARYDIEPAPFHIALFRPKLKPTHQFGNGRAINADKRRIYHDNGWTPLVKRVDVFEVPGDHDSMVLEPNVRVLAVRLRETLLAAEAAAKRVPPAVAPPELVAGGAPVGQRASG